MYKPRYDVKFVVCLLINTDEDECKINPSPCFEHGVCIDQINGFVCQCSDGYTGARCETDIDNCLSSPCVNGVCTDQVDDFQCDCETGFEGKTCSISK